MDSLLSLYKEILTLTHSLYGACIQYHRYLNTIKPELCFYVTAGNNKNKLAVKVNLFGGNPAFTDALSNLDLENPEANGQVYDNWASSVKDFPKVIDQKV